MEEEIRKRVAAYFSCFYNISQKWKEYKARLDRPLTGFKNQIEQLHVLERYFNLNQLITFCFNFFLCTGWKM